MKISILKKLKGYWIVLSNFGFKLFISRFSARKNHKKYNNNMEKYLYKKFKNIFNDSNYMENEEGNVNKTIWMFWWQGIENVPDIVRKCIDSIYRNAEDFEVILLSKENYLKYIQLPEHIIEKQKKGIITLTHLSDIIRVNLLKNYGGVWIDTTIFLLEELPNEWMQYEIFTRKTCNPKWPDSAAAGRWTGFFLIAKSNSIFMECLCRFFDEYWKEKNVLIDYFLIDLIIEIAYEKMPKIKALLDNIPCNNKNVGELMDNLNIKYDEDLWQELKNDTIIHKLSYKKKLSEIDDMGNETFYGKIMNDGLK